MWGGREHGWIQFGMNGADGGGWLGGALWAQFGGEWAGSVEQRSGLGVPSSPVLVGVGSYWGIFFNV